MRIIIIRYFLNHFFNTTNSTRDSVIENTKDSMAFDVPASPSITPLSKVTKGGYAMSKKLITIRNNVGIDIKTYNVIYIMFFINLINTWVIQFRVFSRFSFIKIFNYFHINFKITC